MTRAHAFFSVLDANGNLQPGTEISVFQPTTTTLIPDTVWSADDDNPAAVAIGNPFLSANGIIDFYLANPQRVDIGYVVPGQAMAIMSAVDVSEVSTSAVDLTFPGSGSLSMQVGGSSSAVGNGSVALGQAAAAVGTAGSAVGQAASASGNDSAVVGQAAQASGLQSSAFGQSAQATATNSSAIGQDSAATANNSTALGASAVASAASGTALGEGSTADNTGSTAVGVGANTTEDQQIMLGTPGQSVDIPSFYTLPSIPSGIKFRHYVTDAGQGWFRYHYPVDAVNLLTGQNANFDGGIGTWAAGLNGAVAASVTNLQAGTGSLRLTQTAAGQAYATSPLVAVSPNLVYVGNIWELQPAGGTPATQIQAWLSFFTSGSVLIGSLQAGIVQAVVNGSYIIVDVRATAPSNAAFAALSAGVPSGGAAANAVFLDTAGIFQVPQVS
jgi:hypothetical protein